MIGINIGSLNTSISCGKDLPNNRSQFDILLSDTSQRTCPSVLAFTNTHRLFGDQANLVLRKHLKTSFKYLSRYIGIIPNSPFAEKEFSEFYLCGSDYDKQNNIFQINGDSVNYNLSPESIIVGFLDLIKHNYIDQKNIKPEFYVFSYPDYFTWRQRNSLFEIIRAVGIEKDYHIVNESTVITLYFGYKKYKEYFLVQNPSNPKPNSAAIDPSITKYVIFIDAGHSKTSFILSKLKYNLFTVLRCNTVPFLGGRNLDEAIFKYCADLFFKQTQIDITKNKKVKLRLLEVITKARKNLTVNQDVSISVDSLCEDHDFSLILTRQEFEKIIANELQQFRQAFTEFYQAAIQFEQGTAVVSHIEMAGELLRTPALQRIIKEVSNIEISKGILTDECIAIGCSLYGTLMKGTFPIKNFNGIFHINNYPITMMSKGKLTLLCDRDTNIPVQKREIFTRKDLENQIQTISFYHPKETVNFFVPSETGLLVQYLFDGNKLLQTFPRMAQLNIDILIDNNASVAFRKAEVVDSNGKEIKAEVKDLMAAIKLGKTELYLPYEEQRRRGAVLLEQEKKLFEIDNNYVRYFSELNQIEGYFYEIRNKINSKNMGGQIFQGMTISEYMNKIEENIHSNRETMVNLDPLKKALNDLASALFPRNPQNFQT